MDPPYLAGRDEVLARSIAAFKAGPRSRYFSLGLTGERGVGKTVLLNAIEHEAEDQLGWKVVQEQALPNGELIRSLLERVASMTSRWRRSGRMWKSLQKELSLGVSVGVISATAKASSPPSPARPERALEQLLVAVGEDAADRRTGMLITCDEAHVISRGELAALGKIMQLVTKRRRLPIAVIFAGLPDLRQRFAGGGTFLERLEVLELGHLTPEAARLALVQPAAELGVAFVGDALEALVKASDGYPYAIQLLGYEAWEAAAGAKQVTAAHAAQAVGRSGRRMADLYEARWLALPERERSYLRAVAVLGPGPASVLEVAVMLESKVKSLSPRRQELLDRRLLRSTRRGEVEFALAGMREWVLAIDA